MTDNAAKKAARKLQRETGLCYTRALGQVAGQRTADIAGSLSVEMLQELLKLPPGAGLDIEKLWREHSLPVGTGEPVVMDHLLRVPIGLGPEETPVFLDFKERAGGSDGPHCLIIDRTGLGRTTTLQTIALGLFTQHSPDVVRALFINATSGGAGDDFADWPHVEPLVVTAPKRGQSSLARCGDLLRDLVRERVELLAEAGRQVKGEPFTLREYYAARATAAGADLPPIPFMFVVVDDFPALLRQRPSLRGSFDAVARFGWPLGLVLLLGSQTGGAEVTPCEWEIGYRIDLDATAGEPRGSAHFLSSRDAEPVQYQRFHIPRTTLRAVEQQMPGQRAADTAGSLSVEMLERLLNVAPGVGLDIEKLWREHSLPVGTGEPVVMDHLLRVPIGLQPDKTPVFVDFKEEADGGDGPHGLMIGMTGSGKSSSLAAMALGLFTQHSPDVVQAILCDVKGGAGFDAFADWPHIRSVVTALDEIDRFGETLLGVVDERAEVIAETGRQVRGAAFESLREYNTFRATVAGADLAPMPFIFVWVDDFALMLNADPGIADVFDILTRRGRALGIFFLFAGQILDEGQVKRIPDNTQYRIGLKVASESTSRDVIGTADAFHVPDGVQGTGYFVRAPGADPVRYQGFRAPSGGLLRTIGRQVANAHAAML